MTITKKTLMLILILVFGIGYFSGFHSKECKQGVILDGKANTNTTSAISYIPRKLGEKTDIDFNIKKQDLQVKVNGKDVEIKKADNENFIFDKNKLAFEQESKVQFEIRTETIDNTRRFGLGAFYDSSTGFNGAVMFPAFKIFGFHFNGMINAGHNVNGSNIGAGLFLMVK